MNLNTLAESDLEYTLEDKETGWGVSLFFLDETETEIEIICQTTDIRFFLDPDTGMGVSSRQVEVSCRISTVNEKNVIIEKSALVKYYDTLENEYRMRTKHIRPDRKIGIYNILLEVSD